MAHARPIHAGNEHQRQRVVMRKFSQRSLDNLYGLHPHLVVLATTLLHESPFDFAVIQGMRTKAEQRVMVDNGVSWTMNSRHLTGHAFDFMVWHNGRGTWEAEYYKRVGKVAQELSGYFDIPITWGGEWSTFDGGHIELSWDRYTA